MREDRRKTLYKKARDFLEVPQLQAEVQHKALRRGRNIVLRRYAFRKEITVVKGDPKKCWSGTEAGGGKLNEKWGWRLT